MHILLQKEDDPSLCKRLKSGQTDFAQWEPLFWANGCLWIGEKYDLTDYDAGGERVTNKSEGLQSPLLNDGVNREPWPHTRAACGSVCVITATECQKCWVNKDAPDSLSQTGLPVTVGRPVSSSYIIHQPPQFSFDSERFSQQKIRTYVLVLIFINAK